MCEEAWQQAGGAAGVVLVHRAVWPHGPNADGRPAVSHSQSKACWEKNLKPESKQTKLLSHNTSVNEPADRAFNT